MISNTNKSEKLKDKKENEPGRKGILSLYQMIKF